MVLSEAESAAVEPVRQTSLNGIEETRPRNVSNPRALILVQFEGVQIADETRFGVAIVAVHRHFGIAVQRTRKNVKAVHPVGVRHIQAGVVEQCKVPGLPEPVEEGESAFRPRVPD